jgi:hypothetical protein
MARFPLDLAISILWNVLLLLLKVPKFRKWTALSQVEAKVQPCCKVPCSLLQTEFFGETLKTSQTVKGRPRERICMISICLPFKTHLNPVCTFLDHSVLLPAHGPTAHAALYTRSLGSPFPWGISILPSNVVAQCISTYMKFVLFYVFLKQHSAPSSHLSQFVQLCSYPAESCPFHRLKVS